MKMLVTIPHYYKPKDGGRYGSVASNERSRIGALDSCISMLQMVFGRPQSNLQINPVVWTEANTSTSFDIDIVICTTGDARLTDKLTVPKNLFTVHDTGCTPTLLGFECHKVLRDRLGQYDYYCYMEDDLMIHDPWFFAKIEWFTKWAGDDSLLQPNRYEVQLQSAVRRMYTDAEIKYERTKMYQDISINPELHWEFFGRPITFRRITNPHAGCFFLNQAQMREWISKPYFLDMDCNFISSLESAASIGIMRTFKVYKPAPTEARFLEIFHLDPRYMGNRIRVLPNGQIIVLRTT